MSQSSPLNHGIYCSQFLEAEKPMLGEGSQPLRLLAVAAMLRTKTVSNNALVPEHPRLGCYTVGIKSYFCYSSVKLMAHFLGMSN